MINLNGINTIRVAGALATAAFLCSGTAFAGGDHGTISAGKLAKDAKSFYGKTVTVKAEVEDVFDNNTLSLDEDALLAGGDVLVILPNGMATGLKKDDMVLVSGVVRPYVVADLERDFDFFKNGKIVSVDRKVEFETKPVLVAQSIRTADGRDVYGTHHAMAASAKGHDHGTMTHKADRAAMKSISADKLAKDPSKFYGQTITVTGEVEDILGPNAVTLDEDAILAGHDVLVLLPEGRAMDLKKDDDITVTGIVRRYVVADLDRDFDWFEDGKIVKTDKKIDFESRPVLVATSVRTADGRELLTPPAARVRQ